MAANPTILSNLSNYIAEKTGKPVTGGDPPTGGDKGKPTPSNRIPLPDYKDPASRLKFAGQFVSKNKLPAGVGFGEIPLHVNEKAFWGSDTGKNLATKFGAQYKLDPALLYSSAMVEGMSGLYPNAENKVTAWSGNKDYPVSAAWNFGLDSFQDRLPELQKKGYLTPDFNKNFIVGHDAMYKDPEIQSTLFKDTGSGFQAKAAMMRLYYDELDDYAKKKGVTLNPQQRDFFGLAHFNSGAHGYEMLDAYNKSGLLKDNKFLEKMPNANVPFMYKGKPMSKEAADKLHKEIYGHVAPRLSAARGLKAETLFDEDQPVTTK